MNNNYNLTYFTHKVWSQNGIHFENCDCMKRLKDYPDKHFDLLLLDCPYGIGEDGAKNHTRGKLAISQDYKPYCSTDDSAPSKEVFDELFRVSKNQIIWGANHFISKIPYDSSCWIVWDKENGATDFADCELAWTSFKSAVRKFSFRWSGMLQGDMKNREQRLHPNQKPTALYSWLLTHYAKQGDLILDPMCGSASSLAACYDLGFEAVGFEIDEYYFDKACRRLQDEMAQVRMEL